jgi:hypothetical protein
LSQENPTTPNFDLPMDSGTAHAFAWIAWSLVLVGTVSGAVAAMALVPVVGQQIAAGVSVISLLVATEIRRQLPSSKALRQPQISKGVQ